MKKIVAIGEVLAEIMADTPGTGFTCPQPMTGPFPSGAPAIFVDQAARAGQPCALVSSVGDDDFGRLCLNRLRSDGVDISAIATHLERPTASAFVRYRTDGTRHFVFNIRHSACASVPPPQVIGAALAGADHLHVTGSSLVSPGLAKANLDAARTVRARGGTVSFDPNLRPELMDAPGLRAAMAAILDLADLFLPSGEELYLLTRAAGREAAMGEILARGVSAIIHKTGVHGAYYIDASGEIFQPAFVVREVDPTGAGDVFAGVCVTLWLRGVAPGEALRLAAAAGACAVTQRGPMEGTVDLAQLHRFAGTHEMRAG